MKPDEYIGPTHACAGKNCPGEEHRKPCPIGACSRCGAAFERRFDPCHEGLIHHFTLHPEGNEPHHEVHAWWNERE